MPRSAQRIVTRLPFQKREDELDEMPGKEFGKMARLWLFGLICVASFPSLAAKAQESGWTTLRQGNATVEVPTYFSDYVQSSIIENGDEIGVHIELPEESGSFVFFVAPASIRPFERASAAAAEPTAVLTYKVDRKALGVVSGYWGEEGEVIFYSLCKSRNTELHCFALTYDRDRRALFDPVVERLAKTLR
jgi:hypothetical protein